MGTAKIVITIREDVLGKLDRLVQSKVFPNRSKAIQQAVEEKLARIGRSRLARECAKLDPKFEQALAGEVSHGKSMNGQDTEGEIPLGESRSCQGAWAIGGRIRSGRQP